MTAKIGCRRKPKRLARKLLVISPALGSESNGMAKLLELKIAYTVISGYDRWKNEPYLIELLKYARLARSSTDVLIDDDVKLPLGR